MKEYFISVIAASLLGGVIISLIPEGNTVKHVKLLCSLCAVVCIAFPLISILDSSFDKNKIVDMFEQSEDAGENYAEIYNNAFNEYEIINAQERLKQELLQGFSLDKGAIDVKIITDKNNDVIYISSVRVCIYGSGISINPREVKKYVSERFDCECEIVYDIL